MNPIRKSLLKAVSGRPPHPHLSAAGEKQTTTKKHLLLQGVERPEPPPVEQRPRPRECSQPVNAHGPHQTCQCAISEITQQPTAIPL